MRRFSIALLASALATPAAAHDFWLQPAPFVAEPGSAVAVTILVGHGTVRQRWGVKGSRVVRFVEVGPGGTVDRRPLLHTDSGNEDATLRFTRPGTHMLVLESTHAQSILPALRFDDYLKEEGITPAIAARARSAAPRRDGREIYSRRAKALVQVGSAKGGQAHVTRPVGLTLEIVPQKNPHTLTTGEKLPVLILYQGKPLAGATVKLNNLDFDAKPLATLVTGAAGTATFDIPRIGKWQFNVVWTRPLTGHPSADWDTTFSSLTFGFGPAG